MQKDKPSMFSTLANICKAAGVCHDSQEHVPVRARACARTRTHSKNPLMHPPLLHRKWHNWNLLICHAHCSQQHLTFFLLCHCFDFFWREFRGENRLWHLLLRAQVSDFITLLTVIRFGVVVKQKLMRSANWESLTERILTVLVHGLDSVN